MGRSRWVLGAAALVAALAGSASLTGAPIAERIRSTDELQSRKGGFDADKHPGKALFAENCAACHETGVAKAPSRTFLEMLTPTAVLAAMRGGIMTQQAAHLSKDQQDQVAEYLARTRLADYRPPAPPPACPAGKRFDMADAPVTRLWGHDNSRFVPAADAGLTKAQVPSLKLKWAFAFPNALRARSQPAVGWGTIFAGSQDGTLYAFDLETGCARWTQALGAEVRTGIVIDPATKRLHFGDILGRAYAVDAMTGKTLWRTKVDDHPNATITGTPTLAAGMLYVPVSSLEVAAPGDPAYECCTFRGSVAAIDPATGAIRWQSYTIPNPPSPHGKTVHGTTILGPSGAPVWNSPTYDAARGRIYFGSGENYSSPADGNSDAVFAVNAKTGKRLWTTQLTKGDAWHVGCMLNNGTCPKENGPDLDVAASTILTKAGGREVLLVGQKSGVAHGLDPATGKILWQTRLGHGGTQGGVHFGMASDGRHLFVPINDMADTKDARVYDAAQRGAGLHAVDPATGSILWRTMADDKCAGAEHCDPGISAAITAIPGVVFAGHLDGRFRAYDADSGKVIWEVDTTKPVAGVNGIEGHGGAMSGAGATVARGHVIVNSGYGLYYHMPGNLLMVFAPAQ